MVFALIEQPFARPPESGTAEPGPDLQVDRPSTAAAVMLHEGKEEVPYHGVWCGFLLITQGLELAVGLPPYLRRGRSHLPFIP